jgi:hypothetical protein
MYLTDADLLAFLKKCTENLARNKEELTAAGLPKTGLLFVKENCHGEGFYVDREDNSIMRTAKHFD